MVVTVVAATVLVVPTVAACELPEVTGCDPDPVPAPEPPVPQPELPVEPPAVIPPDTEAAEARLLVLVNDDRRSHGLATVTRRPDVEEIADGHSAAMAAARDIWHNDAYFTASTKRRLGASRVGENVALNRDADDAHRKLMASPQHRANILDPGFSVIGIAVAADEEGRLYITEDFLEPVRAPAATPPKAVTVRAPSAVPPSPSLPPPAAPAAPTPPGVEEAADWDGKGLELAIGPEASLPSHEGPGRPWAAYVLAATLLVGATVGLRRVAC